MFDWAHAMRWFGAGLLALWATGCATTPQPEPVNPNLLAPLGPPEEVFVPSVPTAEPGFWLIGEQFSGQISFEPAPSGALILYRHTLAGAPELVGELTPDPAWMSDGQRRFEGVSDRGVEIEIEMRFQPCHMRGRDHVRQVNVRLGRLSYSGCTSETGPFLTWSENWAFVRPGIEACLAEPPAREPGQVLHARTEAGLTIVRARFGDPNARYECIFGEGRTRWRALDRRIAPSRGEGEVVFAPGRRPRDSEGCYNWETVRDGQGRVIGALGEDACGFGAAPPGSS